MDVLPLADYRTESSDCDLCGSRSARELYTANDRLRNSDVVFSVSTCDGCGVLRTLPAMSDQDLEFYYPNDYWGDRHPPSFQWVRSSQREKTDFLGKCRLTGGRILDVGCGSGLFLRALGSDWECFGVETGSGASMVAAETLGTDRICNCSLIEARLDRASFDVITLWSSLEHMNNPRSNLLEARRLVKSGGTIIVQVPNASSYQARVFGRYWFALDVPRHRYHYNLAALEKLLSATGFQIYKTTYFSKAHNAHALRQSLKARLGASRSRAGFAAFCLSIPFIKPTDFLLTALSSGATLTVAAKAI